MIHQAKETKYRRQIREIDELELEYKILNFKEKFFIFYLFFGQFFLIKDKNGKKSKFQLLTHLVLTIPFFSNLPLFSMKIIILAFIIIFYGYKKFMLKIRDLSLALNGEIFLDLIDVILYLNIGMYSVIYSYWKHWIAIKCINNYTSLKVVTKKFIFIPCIFIWIAFYQYNIIINIIFMIVIIIIKKDFDDFIDVLKDDINGAFDLN